MKPKEILQHWIDLFNQENSDEIANLYHNDAINHQVANERVEGKENIRKMFASEFSKKLF